MPQHAGSDREALRGGAGRRGLLRRGGLRERLLAMVRDTENWSDRPRDVSFVIDRALTGALGVEIDADRVGVMGHSYGAYTVMAVGGMLVDMPGAADMSFGDPRVGAVVAFSPQGTGRFGIDEGAWSGIGGPLLMVTGTEDVIGTEEAGPGRAWEWRREAFDAMRADGVDHHTALAVIEDATHMAFSDARGARILRLIRGERRDPRHHGWILQLTTAWFDAHLRGSGDARAWLDDAVIEEQTGSEVVLEAADPEG